MAKRSRQFTRPTWIRTLGLPRDFQLVAGRRDVRKTDAQSGFLVRHREYSGFRVGVVRVSHTLKAFVRYILHRFKMWYRTMFLGALEHVMPSQPAYCGTVLFPSYSSIRDATTLALRAGVVCVKTVGTHVVNLLEDGGMLRLPRFPARRVVVQSLRHGPSCRCSDCVAKRNDDSNRRFYEAHIVNMYERGFLVWAPR